MDQAFNPNATTTLLSLLSFVNAAGATQYLVFKLMKTIIITIYVISQISTTVEKALCIVN